MDRNAVLGCLIFLPMAGALVSYVIGRFRKSMRDYFADALVVLEFILALFLFVGFGQNGTAQFHIEEFAGFGIHFVMDGFRSIYALIAALMWMMTTVFSGEYFRSYRNRNRYYLFTLLTLGATMGVFLSADLYTAFIFFEMMSFTSYVWVAHDEKKASMRAAQTYLAVAVMGGMVMLMGLFLLYHTLGTLEIASLLEGARLCENKGLLYAAGTCIAIGFGAKAGAFPLHIWLPKAHPVAPAPASALLSGILTKSGIFGVLAVSCSLFYGDALWGEAILIIGTITMFLGAVLALFSVDLKRTLACSSMSQIGFILVGIGMQGLLGFLNEGKALASAGTLLHMINHSLIKLVLFMAAGVVFMNIHKLNLNEIRGFGRKKPLLCFVFLMGALGIGGIPLFNGYISKTLLHESIVEYREHFFLSSQAVGSGFLPNGIALIEWLFLISGGLTVAYMTKLFLAVFVEKNTDEQVQKRFDEKKKYMNVASSISLTVSALLIPALGMLPHILMNGLADRGRDFMHAGHLEEVHYFSLESLKGAGISIGIGLLVYCLIVRFLLMKKTEAGRVYVDRWPRRLDLENSLYRPLLKALNSVSGFFCRILDSLVDWIVVFLRKSVYRDRPFPFELQEGTMFTYRLGTLCNKVQTWVERKFPNPKRRHHEYVHEFALVHLQLIENRMVISRSLSFGLLLICIGLILTTIYLLGVHW